jgi:hypothetical protein
MNSLGLALPIEPVVAAVNPLIKESPASLMHSSLHAYLKFLEVECASYVMLTNLNSALWNPVKDKLFKGLKQHLERNFKGDVNQSGLVRTLLMDKVLSGRYPTARLKNAYVCNDHRFSANSDDNEDYDNITKTLEAVKLHGRKCSSTCCTGAFIAETMLTILVNEDVSHLVFDANLCDRFYNDKPIRSILFFDITSVLVHYILALDKMDDHGDGSKTPALSKLVISSPNMGSLSSQTIYERLLKAYSETRHYAEYPWKLSNKLAKPTSQFMMLTLSNLFDRSANYFANLTVLKLSGECINTRIKTVGNRGGHAVIHLMAGLAHSCPVLEVLDLSDVSSLSPESVLYLFYQDAYAVLHKYMYLPKFQVDDEGFIFQDLEDDISCYKKHNHVDEDGTIIYCPWCDDPLLKNHVRKGCAFDVNSSLYVLDDRLYRYIEDEMPRPASLLAHCVTVSQLLYAFTDPVQVLVREPPVTGSSDEELDDEDEFVMPTKVKYIQKPVNELTTRSPLCYSLKELRLPTDAMDSKSWILPLVLEAVPNLTTLGGTNVYEGFKFIHSLKVPRQRRRQPFKLEEATLHLEEAASFRLQEKIYRRLKTLTTWYPRWSQFCSMAPSPSHEDRPSLARWISSDLKDEVIRVQDVDELKESWRSQILSIVESFPNLRMLKITITPSILYNEDSTTSIWEPLASGLKNLEEMWIHSSCWTDIVTLLSVVGSKLKIVNLMFNAPRFDGSKMFDDQTNIEFINTVPYLCPSLTKVFFGYISKPHNLCNNDTYMDHEVSNCCLKPRPKHF